MSATDKSLDICPTCKKSDCLVYHYDPINDYYCERCGIWLKGESMHPQAHRKDCKGCADSASLFNRDSSYCAGCPNETQPETTETPPICPKCNEPLETVDFYEVSTWNFDKKTGSYQCGDLYGGSAEVQCMQCNTDLGELFPEGPVNYGHTLLEGLDKQLKPKEGAK